jgi:tRNA G18 (ribose-2'-O)-methylase SpoU
MRTETRKERYLNKGVTAKTYPVSVATTNFISDDNVAFVMRALACFGGRDIHIIGRVPKTSELRRLSGGTNELVNIVQHKRPEDFISYTRKNKSHVIVAELVEGAIDINHCSIPLDKEVIFVVGNEMDGVPVEISITANQSIYIPMPGKGFCLNTSQTANILLYEYAKRRTSNPNI